MNIFKTLTEKVWKFETAMYIEDVNLYFSVYENSINMIDLSNAGKTGKTCTRVSIQTDQRFSNWHECKDHFDVKMNGEYLRTWFNQFIENNPAPEGKTYFSTSFDKAQIYFEQLKAVKVFSPFAEYKRLKSAPAKWTKSHVIKALMNGQFKSVNQDAVYTDDYYDDAQRNYQKHVISEAVYLVEKVLDGGSGGWRFYADDENNSYININHYHFDYNHFIFDVEGNQKTFEYVIEKREQEEKEYQEAQKRAFEEVNSCSNIVDTEVILKFEQDKNALVLRIDGEVLQQFSQDEKSEAHKAFRARYDEVYNAKAKNIKVLGKTTVKKYVDLYFSSKPCHLQDHYEHVSNESSSKALVLESIILDEQSFDLLLHSFYSFPITKFSDHKGFVTLPEWANDIPHDMEYDDYDEDQKDYFHKHAVHAVTEVLKAGSSERVYVDCQGYNYARYIGTVNQSPQVHDMLDILSV